MTLAPTKRKKAPTKTPGPKTKTATKVKRAPKLTVGWLEHIDLPELKVYGLRAKLDTGAKSSALHVEHLRHLTPHKVAFDVVLDSHRVRHLTARIARTSRVKSSNGHFERRVFIQTQLRLGPVEREVEVSLVDRERMLHRMLLGRTSLKGLLINPAQTYLLED